MEHLASLPAELAVIADASARGAAPLLRPPDGGGGQPAPVLPFELLLERLAEVLPGGETSPPSGNELPLRPLENGTEAAALAPAVVLMPLLTGPADGALPVLRLTSEPPPTLPSTMGTPSAPQPGPTLFQPSAAPPLLAATADAPAPATGGLESLAAIAAEGAEMVPAGSPLPNGAETPPSATPEREALESLFSTDARLRGHAASTSTDSRVATLAVALPATSTSIERALPAAYRPRAGDQVPAPQGAIRRLDALSLSTTPPAGGEATAVVAGDWLPAAGPSSGTAQSAAPHAPASPSAPVDVRTPSWQEAFAGRVQWVVDTDRGEAHIKLNPPELGAVEVKVSLVDDKTYVQLTAATAAARDELAHSLPRLRELLTVGGLELGGASVHDGRGQHASSGHGAPVAATRELAPFAELPGEPGSSPPRGPAGRIDVFA